MIPIAVDGQIEDPGTTGSRRTGPRASSPVAISTIAAVRPRPHRSPVLSVIDPFPSNTISVHPYREKQKWQTSSRAAASRRPSANPFGCTAYQVGTESHAAVESYTGRIVDEDGEAETVGQEPAKSPTVAAYTANVPTVLGNAALATAMGGTAVHAADSDSFSAAPRCHAAIGEIFTLARGPG